MDDPIAHLDFEPGPANCECVGCPGHGGGGTCGKPATHMVTVHAINNCNRAGLTGDGGVVQLCCAGCIKPRTSRAAVMAERLEALRKQWGGTVECRGCGRPLLEMSDFFEIRSLENV